MLLWVPVTIAAASAQVFRNGAQAGLTKTIGMLGATQVRFVFGLPFALLFLAAALWLTGQPLPGLTRTALGWAALGAVCQILGTALMLVVMHQRAFGVAYAYIKTEPVLVAVLGVILLGDHLSPLAWLAVGVVTAGVLVASVKPGEYRNLLKEGRMIAAGVGAGCLFGLSAIAFRGGIGALEGGDFLLVHGLRADPGGQCPHAWSDRNAACRALRRTTDRQGHQPPRIGRIADRDDRSGAAAGLAGSLTAPQACVRREA
ncbi:MAG: triose-phosphate transporter family protein [Novosphingobium sp.]|nr:triose-phosphate transporter family protein [Novosphingobium sp.]